MSAQRQVPLGAFISAGTTVPDDIYDNTKPPRMFSFGRGYSHDFLPISSGMHTSFLISIPIKTVGWGKILFLYFGGGLSSGNFFYFQVYHYVEHEIWVKVV